MIEDGQLGAIFSKGPPQFLHLARTREERRVGPVAPASHHRAPIEAGTGGEELQFLQALRVVPLPKVKPHQHGTGAMANGL